MVQQASMENSSTKIAKSEIEKELVQTSSPLQKEFSEEAEKVFSVYSVDFSSPADTWNIGEVVEEEEGSAEDVESVGADLQLKMKEHWLEWTRILKHQEFETVEDNVFAVDDSEVFIEAVDLKVLADHDTNAPHCKLMPNLKVTDNIGPLGESSIRIDSLIHLAEDVNNVGTMTPNPALMGDSGLCKSSDDDSDEKHIDERKPRSMNSTETSIDTSSAQTRKRRGDTLHDKENCCFVPKVRRISDTSDPTFEQSFEHCFQSASESRARKLAPGISLEDALEVARRRSTARIRKAMEPNIEYNAQLRKMQNFEAENPYTPEWTHDMHFEF